VNVTSTATGVQNNTTGAVTSLEGGNGGTAFASVAVVLPPSIGENFSLAGTTPNSTFGLTFTLTNPNATASLSNVGFSDTLPSGLVIATPNGVSNACAGATITAAAGGGSIAVFGATVPAATSCTISLNVTALAAGLQTNTTGPVTSLEGGTGNTATASVAVGDTLQVGYAANLLTGDSFLNLTNTGESGNSMCVNVYAFNPSGSMVSCCSCLVTPNALVSLSARNDLINNTLTPSIPSSIVMKLVPSIVGQNSTCNAAMPTKATLTYGLRAWTTTLHVNLGTSPTSLGENPLGEASLSDSELTKLTQTCGFIEQNGSGFGTCRGCTLGGRGAESQ
jgi:hypothetical protein